MDHIIENKSPVFRLIDVDEERIVEIEGLSRYVALSYVLGDVAQPQYTSQTKEIFRQLKGVAAQTLNLPYTIRNAMIVTKQIGMIICGLTHFASSKMTTKIKLR